MNKKACRDNFFSIYQTTGYYGMSTQNVVMVVIIIIRTFFLKEKTMYIHRNNSKIIKNLD